MSEKFELKGDFIELFKLMKLLGWTDSGGEAKNAVSEGLVTVNDNVELRKACKIRKGQTVKFQDHVVPKWSEAMSVREKLQNEIHTDDWQVLRPHFKRDALILVSSDLDLVEAGVAVAEDQIETIQSWLQSAKLSKPNADQVAHWDQNGAVFRCVIVQPYVLVQVQ